MELKSNEYVEIGGFNLFTTGGTLFVSVKGTDGYFRRKYQFEPRDGYHTVISSGSPAVHSYIEVDVDKLKGLQ